MLDQKSGQGTQIRLMRTSLKRDVISSAKLTPGLRCGYASLSFILGVTYLKVIFGTDLPGSPILIGAAVLGLACFAVFTFNLVALLREKI